MSCRRFLGMAVVAAMLLSCGGETVDQEQLVATTAQLYYQYLLDGKYDDFVGGMDLHLSPSPAYKEQLRANAKNGYYEDIAVLAYKLDDNDIPMTVLKPKITSSSGSFTLEELTDGDLTNNRPLYAGRRQWHSGGTGEGPCSRCGASCRTYHKLQSFKCRSDQRRAS